jgi:hypothetical protein
MQGLHAPAVMGCGVAGAPAWLKRGLWHLQAGPPGHSTEVAPCVRREGRLRVGSSPTTVVASCQHSSVCVCLARPPRCRFHGPAAAAGVQLGVGPCVVCMVWWWCWGPVPACSCWRWGWGSLISLATDSLATACQGLPDRGPCEQQPAALGCILLCCYVGRR